MTPKFAQYCNVANVVLISIWTSDNLFRQEYLICMQGGRRRVLWLPPFTSSANAVSQCWREYFFAKDKVQILKQMEDLLNSQLDILMYFILISLLDGNMFFKSDKETCRHLSGWFNSAACLQTPRLSLPIHFRVLINKQGRSGRTLLFYLSSGIIIYLFLFLPDPTLRDSSQAEGAWPVPRPFHPRKALGSRLPQMGTYLGGGGSSVIFFSPSLSLLPPPPPPALPSPNDRPWLETRL